MSFYSTIHMIFCAILISSLTINIVSSQEVESEQDETACGVFKRFPARCRRWRVHHCDTELLDTFDQDKCDKVRFCCPRDIDAGNCVSESVTSRRLLLQERECNVFGIDCSVTENNGIRRLLQGHGSGLCTCSVTV
eukprot:148835_1